MESIVLQGVLEHFARGVGNDHAWQKRYFVLYGTKPGQDGRLEWYETKELYTNSIASGDSKPPGRKTIYMKEVKSVGCPDDASKPYSFRVHVTENPTPYSFAAHTKDSLNQWLSCLEKARTMVQTPIKLQSCGGSNLLNHPVTVTNHNPEKCFAARVIETDASERCGLVQSVIYMLRITSTTIALEDQHGKLINKLSWPYKYIRRYGRSSSSFTFEAGRKCPSGEGLFTFKVDSGDILFEHVQERTRAMKGSPSESAVGNDVRASPGSSPTIQKRSASNPTSPDQPPPQLPTRGYNPNSFSPSQLIPRTDSNTPLLHPKAKAKKHSAPGIDDVDGLISRMTNQSKHTSPHASHSPVMQNRTLPDIPRGVPSPSVSPRKLMQRNSLPGGSNYEEPTLVAPFNATSNNTDRHYALYDVTQSTSRLRPTVDDEERCSSSPADLDRPVIPSHPDEQYSLAFAPPDYAEPELNNYAVASELSKPPSGVSSLLGQIRPFAATEDANTYAAVGDTYACLDLINTRTRPLPDTPGVIPNEAIYGHLATANSNTQDAQSKYGGVYANTVGR